MAHGFTYMLLPKMAFLFCKGSYVCAERVARLRGGVAMIDIVFLLYAWSSEVVMAICYSTKTRLL